MGTCGFHGEYTLCKCRVLLRSRGKNLPCVYSTKWQCSWAAQYILGAFGTTHIFISLWKKLAFTLLSFQCQVWIENEHYISLFLDCGKKSSLYGQIQLGCQGKRQMMSVKMCGIKFYTFCLEYSVASTQSWTHTYILRF